MSTTIADYSNNPAIPTLINLVVDRNNKNILNAVLANNVGGSDTKDYFTFTVPFDQTLTSFKLSLYSSTDGKAFIALQTGNSVTATETNPSALRGYTHFGPSVQGATVDSDLINLLGGPLGPGTYSVWIQQLGALTDYTFELQTTYNKPIVWTRLLGTTSEDQANALTTGTDGAIYVAGYMSGSLDGQINSGGDDAFITKYNPDGTKAWTRLLGTTSEDQANALTTGTDGAIYVAGYTYGNLDGQINSGSDDAFITKYNPDGTKAWTRLLGTTSEDQANALTTGTDGAIYVAGYTYGNLDGQIKSGSNDAFITKYNPDGTKAWTRLLGTTSEDQANALTTGTDGAIYVAGYTYGNLDGQIKSGSNDAFITKYNPDGTKAWTRLLGSTSYDAVNALTTGSDGAIYVAGNTGWSLDGQIYSGSGDAFITKYSTDGTKAWTRLLGTINSENANALTTGSDGAIYVAGYTGGNLDGQINSVVSIDAFITRYNTDGTKAWTRLLWSTLEDRANALTTGSDGAIYVAGYTRGNLDGQIIRNEYSFFSDAFISKWKVVPEPYYTLIPATSIVNEGSTAIFNLTTTNVASSTPLTYTISGVAAADITGGNLTGSVNVGTDGKATISIPIAADNMTEGDETLMVTVQGKSASTIVKDTSTYPKLSTALKAAAGETVEIGKHAPILQSFDPDWTKMTAGSLEQFNVNGRGNGDNIIRAINVMTILDDPADGRQIDPTRLGFWIEQIEEGTLTLGDKVMRDILSGFVYGKEFSELALKRMDTNGDGINDISYTKAAVQLMYRNVLSRSWADIVNDPGANWLASEIEANRVTIVEVAERVCLGAEAINSAVSIVGTQNLTFVAFGDGFGG